MRVGDQPKPHSAGDYLERPQHLVRVVERFAHAHEHEVREFVALGQRNRLVEDFGRRERLLKPLPPRGAEAAAHAASGRDETQSVARSPSGM